MTQYRQTYAGGGFPRAGSVTRWLCGITAVVSLVGSVTQRKWGFGVRDLAFSVHDVLQGQVWRLVTFPWVESGTFGLLMSLLVLWLFGTMFESRWGSRYFIQFFALSAIGAALLAIPLSLAVNFLMPFADIGIAEGPDPAINAMLVSLALTAPDSNVLFGFLLPMRARTLIYIILGIEIIAGIQSGSANLSITLGGMLMGYLLTTGDWRPSRLWRKLQHRLKRRRPTLRVVPIKPVKDRTLH